MSRVAIFEGLGRRRKRRLGKHRRTAKRSRFGVSPKAKPGRHWHMNKNRQKGKTTAARRKFAAAAKSCKVVFRGAGSPVAKRRKFNSCIKNFLLGR
jgi:hypothetical protein